MRKRAALSPAMRQLRSQWLLSRLVQPIRPPMTTRIIAADLRPTTFRWQVDGPVATS